MWIELGVARAGDAQRAAVVLGAGAGGGAARGGFLGDLAGFVQLGLAHSGCLGEGPRIQLKGDIRGPTRDTGPRGSQELLH